MIRRTDVMITEREHVATNDMFFGDVARIIEQARAYINHAADQTMCISYFEIGRMIFEKEQEGKVRAEYSLDVLTGLSEYLTDRFGKGFSKTNLKNFRKFYMVYSPAVEKIEINDRNVNIYPIRQTASAKFNVFKLSWSHYQILMRISDEKVRVITMGETVGRYSEAYQKEITKRMNEGAVE
ncbi:MAG: DUF1016 N-terminal domain-containing protein [Methanomassiliicoccaceae archaeon]|nr:DUF1016 N-terminal domain-containing protein [Methanomassiliicoccaceae archaeon]